jgi:Co/Zn/Cd efflux system component
VSTLANQHQDHSHEQVELGWRALLLLLWGVMELSFGYRWLDPLVVANGYHDLFDVVFVLVVMFGAYSRALFKRWHPARCNIGPMVIIAMTFLMMASMTLEVVDRSHGDQPKSWLSVIILVVSAALILNLYAGASAGSNVWSQILTLHFAVDVLGSLLAALIALLDLGWNLTMPRKVAALAILVLALWAGLKIAHKAWRLIHPEQNCDYLPDSGAQG